MLRSEQGLVQEPMQESVEKAEQEPMRESIKKFIQENQPISITGAFQHVYLWITSSMGDVVYHNPNFNAELAGDNATEIYCVHGTADRCNAFKLIAERLLNDLPVHISAIYLLTFDDRFQGVGIKNLSEQFRNKILSRPDKTIKKIIVMGHSRGCLVASEFAENLAEKIDVEVQAIFSICGPFKGSNLALAPLSWFSDSIKQMERNSEFLNDLVYKIKVSNIPYYFFAAENDFIVSVDSANVSGPNHSLVVLDRHGHLSIMSSHRLVGYLLKIISGLNGYAHQHEADDNSSGNFLNLKEKFNFIPKSILALEDACQEIDDYLEELKKKAHIWSANSKILVLEKLKSMLINMRDGHRGESYINAETIGAFINEYLQDANSNHGIKPIDVLNSPLNYPFSFLQGVSAHSQNFASILADKYKEVLLPRRNLNLELNCSNRVC